MAKTTNQHMSKVVFAVMGATGTGKSTFIRFLTNNENIRIGHNQDSETFDIQTADYTDLATGRPVMLIDTPGFDDSREGITDTDILQKIIDYLEPETGERRKLNGIIYMHRISDPRVGGVSRKNLRMFQSLCGEKNLANVRIVTTNWSRVTEEEGNHREADLRNGAFKALVDAGARMCRHANTLESARRIMSDLIPLEAVTMRIQEEVRSGKKLSDTGAGMVLTAEMQNLIKRHEQEMADLKKELEIAARANERVLRIELEQERKALEEKISRVEADRAKLERTLGEQREEELKRREGDRVQLEQLVDQLTKHHGMLAQIQKEHEKERVRATERQHELERQIADAYKRMDELSKQKPGGGCLIC